MYTVLFWEREKLAISTGMVLLDKKVIFVKVYENTLKQKKEMRLDMEEWEDADPVCRGTTVMRDE